MLSKEQINFYHKNGFLIVPNFAKSDEVKTLRQEMETIVEDFDMEEMKVFTTDDQNKHTDAYFLESGDKIRCFFEEGALDDSGNLRVEKSKALNKVGHALHDLNPVFKQFSYKKELLEICKQLGMQLPSIAQSQYIFKQPKIGAKVHAHTDSTFIYTDPVSCLGAWVALEDATTQNGCLQASPGSHVLPLQERFIRNTENTGTVFVTTNDIRVQWDLSELIPLEAKTGDLVLLHGQVVHASYANSSSNSRHSYIVHLIDLNCNYPDDNWLQRSKDMPFLNMEDVMMQNDEEMTKRG